jgi:hypothetical protein
MKRAVLAIVMLAAGCGAPAPRERGEAPAPPAKSSIATVVDGMTGRTAVRSGRKAREEVTRISEQRNRDLESVME